MKLPPRLEAGFAPDIADVVTVAGIFVDRFQWERGRAPEREPANSVIDLAFDLGYGLRAVVFGGRLKQPERSGLAFVQVLGNQVHALGRCAGNPGGTQA